MGRGTELTHGVMAKVKGQHERRAYQGQCRAGQLGRGLKSVLVMGCVALLGIALMQVHRYVLHADRFRLRTVQVTGEVMHVDAIQLKKTIRAHLGQAGFFSTKVTRLQRAVSTLPWVKQVTVRRVWPASLRVTLVEKVPVARWGDSVLTEEGTLIPWRGGKELALPILQGPIGQQQVVWHVFQQVQQQLLPLHLLVEGVSLRPHGDWLVVLRNGVQIELGRTHFSERLARLVSLYPQLVTQQAGQVAHIDLRYRHGVAMEWNSAGR